MGRSILVFLVLAACVFTPAALRATPLPVNFTAGGFSQYGIGYDAGDPNFDQVVIPPNSGSIALTQGLPRIVTTNAFTFGVAYNSNYEELVTGLSTSRSLTLNGVTHTIAQPFQVAISYSDTLTIFAGPTVEFDLGPGVRVEVTPLGVPFPPEPIGIWDGSLQAEFLYDTPEPGTLVMVGLGLIGLAGWGLRRMRS